MGSAMRGAGLDPSNIEERAGVLHREQLGKRKRAEERRLAEEEDEDEEDGMEVDDDDEMARLLDDGDDLEYAEGEAPDGEPDDEDDEEAFLDAVRAGKKKSRGRRGDGDDAMDVDEEDDGSGAPKKRKRVAFNQESRVSRSGKGAKGGVTEVGKRGPRSDRSLAGMRDDAQAAKAVKLRNLGQRGRNMQAKAGEGDRHIRTKMVSDRVFFFGFSPALLLPLYYSTTAPILFCVLTCFFFLCLTAQTFVRWEEEDGQDQQAVKLRSLTDFFFGSPILVWSQCRCCRRRLV
jgi:hypothetical protein